MGVRSTGSHSTTTQADGHLLEYFRQNFGAGGGGVNNLPKSGLTASGGIINDYSDGGNIYRAHIFTSSGTFDVTAPGAFNDTLEYLVVAGGGGGGGFSGANGGGGGGAGGLRTNLSGHPLAGAAYPVPAFPTSYTVTVGAGGGIRESPGSGFQGSNSEFYPTPVSYPSTQRVRAVGGGAGGYNPVDGGAGGSGGGGAAPSSATPPGNNPSDPNHPQPMGNSGGHGNSNNARAGGGGGGAGGAGENASGTWPGSSKAGNGGLALQVLIGGTTSASPVGTPGPSGQGWFAGGGGAAGADQTLPDARRGIGGRGPNHDATTPYGGGGNGAPGGNPSLPRAEMNGLFATGGGGGGGRESPNPAGQGGSGIVVIRYQIGTVQSSGTSPKGATGGAITVYNSKVIHTFTSSGTFTAPGPFNETVEYVVVAGGGSGAVLFGGGGAGGYRTGTTPISGPGSTTVQVGAGGASPLLSNSNPDNGENGTPSYFGTPITSAGGGGGASAPGDNGADGGSGGGGPDWAGGGRPGGAGNTPPVSPPQGNPGGDASGLDRGGGGGGGAGGAGQDGGPNGGDGGIGVQLPTTFRDPKAAVGQPGPGGGKYWVAGGGGGGAYHGPTPSPQSFTGGAGGGSGGPYAGGGDGGDHPNGSGYEASENTGGGGGGGTRAGGYVRGGMGGSGIVLIAYPE